MHPQQPTIPAQVPPAPPCKYTYLVRFVNPKKKSDFTLRNWYDVNEKFTSIASLKLRLMDTFPTEFSASSSMNFQIGYLEPPSQAKRWLCELRDLQQMYKDLPSSSKITLWCETTLTKDNDSEEPPAKRRNQTPREKLEDDLQVILDKLKQQHHDMETTKLRLWAKLIQSGHHDSYTTPPNIPLITGTVAVKPKKSKDGVANVVAEAATAIVKAINPPTSPTPGSDWKDGKGISPLKAVSLRRSCLEDLKKAKELYEDEVLTKEEFEEEKRRILEMLRGLGK